MSKYDAAHAQLEERLARLLSRVGKIETDLRQTHNPNWTEQATEQENDEVLQGLDAMGQSEVRHIRAALERIANGSYGTCSGCGDHIGAERLAAIPSVSTCLACASRQPSA